MRQKIIFIALGAFLAACASVPKDMPESPLKSSLPVAFGAVPLFTRAQLNSFSWKPPIGRVPFPHIRLTMIPTQNTRNFNAYISRTLHWIANQEGPLTGEINSETALAQIQEVLRDNFAAASQNLNGADLSADVDLYARSPVLGVRGEENKIRLDLSVAFMTPGGKRIAVTHAHSEEAMSSSACSRYIKLAHAEGFPASHTQCFERGFLVALSGLLDHFESSLMKSEELGLFQSQIYAQEAANAPITKNMFSTPAVAPKESVSSGAATALNSDVDAPVYAESSAPDDFALVVGVEKYENAGDAQFASNDARAMRRHLLALGFPDKNIALLLGDQATKSGIDKYLSAWLPDHVSKKSKVFFFFSGHGASDSVSHQAYLVPWDGDPSFLANTGYSLTRLYHKLGSLKAGQVVAVLDSCFSGEGPRSVMARGLRPLVQKVDMGPVLLGATAALAAAGPAQTEGTLPEEGHGILTYYLLKSLNKTKGLGVLKQLYQYVEPRVEDVARNAGRIQTPQLMGQKTDVTLGGKLK